MLSQTFMIEIFINYFGDYYVKKKKILLLHKRFKNISHGCDVILTAMLEVEF